MRKGRRKGFTLLELVIAVAIMIIIGAGVAPLLLQHLKDARVANLNEQLINIRTAFNSYYTANEGVITPVGDDYLQAMVNEGWLNTAPSDKNFAFKVKMYDPDATVAGDEAYYIEIQNKNDLGGNFTDAQLEIIQALDEKLDGTVSGTAGILQYEDTDATADGIANVAYYKISGKGTWHP